MWNMIGLWLLQYKLIAGWLVDIFVIHSTDVVIGWQWDVDPVGMGDISYGDDQQYHIPSSKLTKKLSKITIFNGKTHYFDWAIFNSFLFIYQRVIWYCWVSILTQNAEIEWIDDAWAGNSCGLEAVATKSWFRWENHGMHGDGTP